MEELNQEITASAIAENFEADTTEFTQNEKSQEEKKHIKKTKKKASPAKGFTLGMISLLLAAVGLIIHVLYTIIAFVALFLAMSMAEALVIIAGCIAIVALLLFFASGIASLAALILSVIGLIVSIRAIAKTKNKRALSIIGTVCASIALIASLIIVSETFMFIAMIVFETIFFGALFLIG